MLRELMTCVTAMAMLWHAIVGCCAHHSHGINACATNASFRTEAEKAPEGRHCCYGGSHSLGPSGHSLATFDSAVPRSPCSEPSPGRCTERTCVFGVSTKSGPSLADSPASTWIDAAFFAVGPTRELLPARGLEFQRSHAPPPFGGLRSHLALSILTL